MSEPQPSHLLVVDDHREIRDALQAYLERNGYRVTTAANAQAARQALAAGRIDLVVLDIMMPGEDGLALCRWIRENVPLPVIFLTAMAEPTDRVVGLELGADDYLIKPFDPRELLARIRAVHRRVNALPPRSRLEAHRIRFADWELDLTQRELQRVGGETVPLSGAEFELLCAFLRYPDTVLSRDQLLELTQGGEARAFDRRVDIQVSRLRRKVEIDPAQPRIIKTQWGGGYALVGPVETVP
jgi:two-component system OmpR family response regulator